MFFKGLLCLLGVVAAARAGRLDNTYLPPSSANGAGGSDHILAAPGGASAAPGVAAGPAGAVGVNRPTGVKSNSESINGGVGNPDAGAAILKFDNEHSGDGGYKFEYETENEIHHTENGELKNIGTENEAMSVTGSYSYMGPDGVLYTVTYVADENGFRATGDHLPTAPPVSEAIQTALDKIVEMEAAEQANDNSGNGYHRGHNEDTQSVVIEAEPQTAAREYLPPQAANNDVPANGYRY